MYQFSIYVLFLDCFGFPWDSTWISRWVFCIFAKNIIGVLRGIVLNLSIIPDNIDVLTILTLPIYEHGHISIYLCFRLCISEFLRNGLFLICLYFSVQPILQGFSWKPQVFIIVPFTHTHTNVLKRNFCLPSSETLYLLSWPFTPSKHSLRISKCLKKKVHREWWAYFSEVLFSPGFWLLMSCLS